jgi:hypothetical protein
MVRAHRLSWTDGFASHHILFDEFYCSDTCINSGNSSTHILQPNFNRHKSWVFLTCSVSATPSFTARHAVLILLYQLSAHCPRATIPMYLQTAHPHRCYLPWDFQVFTLPAQVRTALSTSPEAISHHQILWRLTTPLEAIYQDRRSTFPICKRFSVPTGDRGCVRSLFRTLGGIRATIVEVKVAALENQLAIHIGRIT